MKNKLIFFVKLGLFLLPFIAYFMFFSYYEPHNYFGNQPTQAASWNMPVSKLRGFMRKPNASIIIGDSRMLHVNPNEYPAIEGWESPERDYYNLACSGQSLAESIDTFWFAADRMELKQVVFGVSFYSVNENITDDRIKQIYSSLLNPLEYMLNFSYNKQALEQWKLSIQKTSLVASAEVAAAPAVGDHEDYISFILETCANYKIDYGDLNELKKIADYCNKNNIELIFVAPPMHICMWRDAIPQLNIREQINEYKTIISDYAVLYDMEFPDCPYTESDCFMDGVHFNGNNPLFSQFLKVVLSDSPSSEYYQKWDKDRKYPI